MPHVQSYLVSCPQEYHYREEDFLSLLQSRIQEIGLGQICRGAAAATGHTNVISSQEFN